MDRGGEGHGFARARVVDLEQGGVQSGGSHDDIASLVDLVIDFEAFSFGGDDDRLWDGG